VFGYCLHSSFGLAWETSAKCYMCGAKPTEMNDLDKRIEKTVRDERYRFGLSPLHSYMRFFKYFLYISYRLDQKATKKETTN